jgi:predicted acyl esterase
MEKHLKKRSIDTGPEFVYDIQNGDGTWRTAASGWPVVDSTRETRLFLHGSFKGNSLKISQKFLFEFPGSAVANVPLAKTSLTEISGQGMLPEEYHFIPFDSPLTSSEFISEPFEYDTEITGIPKANLWLSGIGRDITFFIKLYIIDGNGSVSPSDSARIKDIRIKDLIEDIKEMADNQQARPGEDDLSSHHITPFKIPPSEPFEASGESSVMKFNLNDYNRASDEFWNDLLSGKPISGLLSDIPIFELDKPAGIIKPTLYSFDLRGMSRVIKKGQRIKLIIATSDFCYSHSRLPAVGIIWHSAKYPSSINLPIVRD